MAPLIGPPSSEDFAFDELGNLASFNGTLLVLTDYAGTSTPIATSLGGAGGPPSLRCLPSSGHFVFHDVDTSTLYEVDPLVGSLVPVFSGFGYAGAIEARSDELLYVVDLAGLHLIDPSTGDHELTLESAPRSHGEPRCNLCGSERPSSPTRERTNAYNPDGPSSHQPLNGQNRGPFERSRGHRVSKANVRTGIDRLRRATSPRRREE